MSQDGQRLYRREACPHTQPRTASEGQVLEPVATAFGACGKSFVVENIRIFPKRSVALDEPGPDRDNVARGDVFTPKAVRSHSLSVDGIRRIVRGEAIAAGMPDDRMPVVKVREAEYTPATFNTDKLTTQTAALLTQRFGAHRVKATPAVMGGEDFGRFYLADKSIESLIFWVGGVPQAKWQAARGDPAKLPSLHSPFWAPDAEPTIATATEAMTAAALGVLGRS